MPYRSIIARPLFDKNRALPRMSWAPENLYNLWQRVSPDGPLRSETNFTRTSLTLFQQRWRAKRLSRGYHGDHIAEQKFERWYLPDALPSIHGASSTSTSTKTSKSRELGKMVAGRTREGGRAETERTKALLEKKSRTPIGTLLYREVERRLDVLMFRACFATSVWQARQLVVHRKVRVNGVVVNNPNVRLNPGDLFSVDPQAIPMLSKQVAEQGKKQKQVVETPAESSESSEDPTSETSADAAKSDSETKPTSKSTSKDAYFTLPPYAAPHLFIPAYLEPNFKTCACVYVRHPTARPGYSEVPSPYDADGEVMSLAWEWFKKKGEYRDRGFGDLRNERELTGRTRFVAFLVSGSPQHEETKTSMDEPREADGSKVEWRKTGSRAKFISSEEDEDKLMGHVATDRAGQSRVGCCMTN